MASRPAPIAPASPQCSCSTMSGCARLPLEVVADEVDLRLDGREVALRAALQHEPPPEARRGSAPWRRRGTRSAAARPPGRRGSPRGFQPCRCTLAISDCRNSTQPWPKTGISRAVNAVSANCSTGYPKLRAIACRKYPLPAEHCGVQPEVLHPAVVHHDDLDVLAADVHDDVRVLVDVQRGLACATVSTSAASAGEHVLQDVLRVAGGDEARHVDARALRLDLRAAATRTSRSRPRSGCPATAGRPWPARAPSSSSSTALVDVEPASRPMNPRTRVPGASAGGVHAGRSYIARNSARSMPEAPTAAAPRRAASGPRAMAAARRAGPRYSVTDSRSRRANSTAPSAPKYSASSGVTIRSCGARPRAARSRAPSTARGCASATPRAARG